MSTRRSSRAAARAAAKKMQTMGEEEKDAASSSPPASPRSSPRKSRSSPRKRPREEDDVSVEETKHDSPAPEDGSEDEEAAASSSPPPAKRPRAARPFKAAALNVNGLRALLRSHEEPFHAWVEREQADVLMLSETKIDDSLVSSFSALLPEYPKRYWNCCRTRKGYSGVVVFCKQEPLAVTRGIGDAEGDDEGRAITVEFDKLFVVGTYVPNAGQKLQRLQYRTETWDARMRAYLDGLREQKTVLWMGDLNVAHEVIDIHKPNKRAAGFTPEERKNFDELLAAGWADSFRRLHPDKQQFTYWSWRKDAYASNKGWRLDYVVLPDKDMPAVEDAFVRGDVRVSDHCPVGVTVDLDRLG